MIYTYIHDIYIYTYVYIYTYIHDIYIYIQPYMPSPFPSGRFPSGLQGPRPSAQGSAAGTAFFPLMGCGLMAAIHY